MPLRQIIGKSTSVCQIEMYIGLSLFKMYKKTAQESWSIQRFFHLKNILEIRFSK